MCVSSFGRLKNSEGDNICVHSSGIVVVNVVVSRFCKSKFEHTTDLIVFGVFLGKTCSFPAQMVIEAVLKTYTSAPCFSSGNDIFRNYINYTNSLHERFVL